MSEATYDFDFRPDYWEVPADPIAELTRNVKGQLRRKLIAEIVSGHAGEEEVHPDLLPDELDDPNLLGHLHPWFMGGEYLPDYLPGELEIARIVLESTTMDVISIRARPEGQNIHYRVLDEYPEQGPLVVLDGPTTSERPLTFGELVRLIDVIKPHPNAWCDTDGDSYVDFIRDNNTNSYSDLERMSRFVTLESTLYPQLYEFFEERAQQWLVKKKAERAAAEERDQKSPSCS